MLQVVKRYPLPCGLLFPLLSILLWTGIIAVPATLNYARLLQLSAGAADAFVPMGEFTAIVPRRSFLRWSFDSASVAHGTIIEGVNIFGLPGEALASWNYGTWPESWYPGSFELMSWRGVVFPFYCLPFWLLAGIGFDGLLRRYRLRWPVLLLGTLLFCFTVILAVSFRIWLRPEDRADNYRVSGLALWSTLLAVFPIQWIARWNKLALTGKFRARSE